MKEKLSDESQQLKEEKKNDGATALDDISNALEVAASVVDVYEKYKDDRDKIEAASNGVLAAQTDFEIYKKYEQRIYNTLGPMLDQAYDNFMDWANSLQGESQVSLDVSRWNIQTSLKQLKKDIVSFVKGFKVEATMVDILSKVWKKLLTYSLQFTTASKVMRTRKN